MRASPLLTNGRCDAIVSGVLTLNFLSFDSRTGNSAAPLLFALFITMHLLVLFVFLRIVFPATWDQQLSAGLAGIAVTCLVCNLIFCFGEYFFHRYLLHVESVKLLRRLSGSHLAHHKLTSIRFDEGTDAVCSAYAITDAEHDRSATFPPWALLLFFGFMTPFLAPIAFSFPHVPILIGGYLALAIAHFLYETIHVLHHVPYDPWWKRRIEGPLLGKAWRSLYGFHQAHHANYRCNLNVAGFFGIPLADLAFGTYKQPKALLLDGTSATKEAARQLTPQPRWLIAWLDRTMLKRRRRMSKEN